jgi:hypothetical protein
MTQSYLLQRYSDNRESTTGLLFKRSTKLVLMGYTLEDEFRDVKVKKDTRIPEGKYEIIINRAETPLTLKYRSRYNWFLFHLMLKDVPNFTGIYFHVGKNDDWTDGCITMGNTVNNNNVREGEIGDSVECFRKFYTELYDHLDYKFDGKYPNNAFIEIRDEKKLL